MSAMLAELLRAEFGDDFEDARQAMADRPGFRDRPLSMIENIAVHHSASAKTTTWAAVRDSHWARKPEPFAGIGYHIGVRGGVVSYLGDIGQGRACVARQNHKVVCVCLTGNYEGDPREGIAPDPLDADDLDALRRVVAVLDVYLGRQLPVVGHGEVEGGPATACPGRNLLAVLPTLRQVPAPPPPRADEATFALLRRIRDGLAGREVIALNPAAGLQRAIRRGGYVVTTAEWSELDGGVEYICQGAATVDASGRVKRRVYFVRKPEWDAIRFVEA